MKSGVKEQLCGFTLNQRRQGTWLAKPHRLSTFVLKLPLIVKGLSFLPSRGKQKHRATMKDTQLWLTLLRLPLRDSTAADRLGFFFSRSLRLAWTCHDVRARLDFCFFYPTAPTAHSTVWTIKLTFYTNKQWWLVNIEIYQAFGQPIEVFELTASKCQLLSYKGSMNTPLQAKLASIWLVDGVGFSDYDERRTISFLSATSVKQNLISNPEPPDTLKVLNISVAFSSVILFLHCKQNKKKFPLSFTAGLTFESTTVRESGLGTALAVGVCPRGAGVWVWIVVVVLVLGQAFLPYSPVGGTEASQQTLVVKTAALFAKRVLGVRWRGVEIMENKQTVIGK